MKNFARVTYTAISYGFSLLIDGAGMTALAIYAITVLYPNDIPAEFSVVADLAPAALLMAAYFAVFALSAFLIRRKLSRKVNTINPDLSTK